ncbi:hypothetical protein [Chelativorans sp. M5D2P16]|uniref:hypothetical protein n=1 Tax=Chelativorans sp. M5D2P16 TaxID=3095678 RepID=UPI002ACAFE57|nr:hypothetical protein [Chelativorans sp. M5D2P16]MDZ5697694.1 hypothetical protein [Chelativorans sp. M5D2P16]
MNEHYDTYAVAIIIVFGAMIIGGLMAGAVAFGARDAFFFALGAATAAWLSGYAVFFDRPRTFMICVAVSIAMAIGATIVLAF